MIALIGGRAITPRGVLSNCCVEIHKDRIVGVTSGRPDAPTVVDLEGAWLLPGFIDMHVHGGGGHDVAQSRDDMASSVEFHRTHGTTRSLISLVTAPVAELCEQLGWIADLVGPQVAGAHLEGPFLAHARCGAQNPASLLIPDIHTLRKLLTAGRGQLRSITIAPELPGALDLIAASVRAGVIAALGHSDATYAQAMAGFAAGATLATHVFNGMGPLHHREPGVVGAALDSGLACEVINDGAHVHAAIIRLIASDPKRLVLVTDAIDAAGAGDGDYVLGGQAVRVVDGHARLKSTGALAGSTLTMDDAVRRSVIECGLPIEVAAEAASSNPARVLGMSDRCGAIAPGLEADLVVLDDALRVVRVMKGGQWT
jgi:N-acetylglucosamine-6-phosphate deacetylase